MPQSSSRLASCAPHPPGEEATVYPSCAAPYFTGHVGGHGGLLEFRSWGPAIC